MKKNLRKSLSYAFILNIILCSKIFAQNEHKVHEHGTSNVTIALDKNVLQIQLEAPLVDIIGFEGRPKTELQKQAYKVASNKLKNWKNILKFETGSCSNKRVAISDKHKNRHVHKHKNHDNEEKNIHTDIKVLYEFYCTDPINFKSLKVKLFEIFPDVKKINVQWTTNSGQGQKALNLNQNEINIR